MNFWITLMTALSVCILWAKHYEPEVWSSTFWMGLILALLVGYTVGSFYSMLDKARKAVRDADS